MFLKTSQTVIVSINCQARICFRAIRVVENESWVADITFAENIILKAAIWYWEADSIQKVVS